MQGRRDTENRQRAKGRGAVQPLRLQVGTPSAASPERGGRVSDLQGGRGERRYGAGAGTRARATLGHPSSRQCAGRCGSRWPCRLFGSPYRAT